MLTNMETTMKLNVIEGDYGLVSLDVGCIQSILYAKLLKIPIEINVLNGIKEHALCTAPSLVSGNDTIEGFSNIAIHFRKTVNFERSLTLKQASETLALSNFVTAKLRPVLEFLYWVDPRNCDDFTSRWYMKVLPFPFNYAYVKRKKNEATQLIEVLYPLDTDLETIKDFIIKSATQCLSTLSTRLGKRKYFHGDKATTVDVIIYGYLSPLIKLPFPSNEIASLLSMWPNLTEFVKRIDAKYFPDVKVEVKYLVNEVSNKQNDEDVSYMAVFIMVASATSLLLGFALKKGLISVSRSSR